MTLVALYGAKEIPEAAASAVLGPELARTRPSVLAHGGTRGVDRAAEEWCAREMVSMVRLRADFRRHGTDCGRVRDENAAAWAQTVVALWDVHARAHGGMVRAALRMGKRVVLLVMSFDWVLVDRLDTGEGATPGQVLQVLDREPTRRPRIKRAPTPAPVLR